MIFRDLSRIQANSSFRSLPSLKSRFLDIYQPSGHLAWAGGEQEAPFTGRFFLLQRVLQQFTPLSATASWAIMEDNCMRPYCVQFFDRSVTERVR